MNNNSKSVLFVALDIVHFAAPFHAELRELLAAHQIKYDVVCGTPKGLEVDPAFATNPDWAINVNNRKISLLGQSLFWQPVFGLSRPYDLVIVIQQNKRLVNYPLQLRYMLGGTKLAFYGHGKNHQSGAASGLRERWKRFWLTRVHWWFAYTSGVADIVADAGFARKRITVFNNAVDTSRLRDDFANVTLNHIQSWQEKMGITSQNIGIYIGGMYKGKRLDFLIESARLIKKELPDFELLLVGTGKDAHIAETAAATHDFIHHTGPQFGRDKAVLAKMSKVFLLPGVVGLAVLDAFAFGLPMVTTAVSGHGPEIDYLEDGRNGVIVQNPDSATDYADAVVTLMKDESKHQKMVEEGRKCADLYTIENMAGRFAEGIVKALADQSPETDK